MGMLDNVLGYFKSDEFKALPAQEREYRGLLAGAAYAIDGQVDAREKADFETFRAALPREVELSSDGTMGGLNFSTLQRRHRALDWSSDKKKQLSQWIRGRVAADGEVASEEEAFLIQMGQILHEGERVSLFLGAPGQVRQPEHDFFEYLTEERFREDFPNSRCYFTKGHLYTYHPFLNAALVPFTEEGLKVAQLDTMRGVIALVQELGAKQVTIKHSRNFSAAIGYTAGFSAVVPGESGTATLSETLAVNGEVLQSNGEVLTCTFQGRVPVYAKWVPWFWKRRMLQRYAGCDKFLEIIEARLSPNPEQERTHAVRSDRSGKFSASLAFAIKVKGMEAGENLAGNASGSLALNEELQIKY